MSLLQLSEDYYRCPPRCKAVSQLLTSAMTTTPDLRCDEAEIQECEFWSLPVDYDFGVSRRSFVQFLSAGIMLAVSVTPALAQRSGGLPGGFCRCRADESAGPEHFG